MSRYNWPLVTIALSFLILPIISTSHGLAGRGPLVIIQGPMPSTRFPHDFIPRGRAKHVDDQITT